MDRYAIEAAARADEILDLFDQEKIDTLREWLVLNLDKELATAIFTLSPRAGAILAQTPAKDRAWVQKSARDTFVREWLAARHWAIASARALQIASTLQAVRGLGYRQAVQYAAPVAARYLDLPDTEDLLSLRLLDR